MRKRWIGLSQDDEIIALRQRDLARDLRDITVRQQ
jgi:hypothetical protein